MTQNAQPKESDSTQAFENLALPHMNALFRSAAFMLGNRTEAEDIVQQVYLEAWKSFHRFKPGSCRAWLYKILFHTISHHRQKLFGKVRFVPDTSAVENKAFEPPKQERITDEEILEAFRNIPQRYSAVVMLADVHEFRYKEIQETLGIPIGTVMSRLSRGRKLLRVQLSARRHRASSR